MTINNPTHSHTKSNNTNGKHVQLSELTVKRACSLSWSNGKTHVQFRDNDKPKRIHLFELLVNTSKQQHVQCFEIMIKQNKHKHTQSNAMTNTNETTRMNVV